MKKTTKRFMSACAAIALAAVMAFGGIGTAVANAASVEASKMDVYMNVEEAEKAIAEAQAELEAAIKYVQENYDTMYAEAYAEIDPAYIDVAVEALKTAEAAVRGYVIPDEVKEAIYANEALTDEAAVDAAMADFACAQENAADAIAEIYEALAVGNFADIQTAYATVLELSDEATCAWEDLLVIAETLSPAVKADLQALYEEYAPVVEAAINDFLAAVEAKIAEVEAEIEAIKAEIQAQIEEQIAAVEKAIEDFKAAVEEELEAIKAELEAKYEELKAQLAAAEEAARAEIEAAMEAIEAVLAQIDVTMGEVEAVVDEAIAFIEKAIEDTDAAIAEIEAAIETLKAEVEAAKAEIEAAIEAAYLAAITGEYEVGKDSYYFALGDSVLLGDATYADKLAAELTETYGLPTFEKTALDGFRAEDFLYLLDDSTALDAYGVAETKEAADEARDAVVAQIAAADLISISFGNDNFTSFVASQFPTASYEMDWASIVTEEGVPYVEEALATVLADMTTGDEAADAVVATVVEAYAYAFAGFAANYTAVLDEIHAINPEAEVIVTGMYNPVDDMVVEGVAVGEYVDYFIELSNTMFTAYALVTPNTTFVAIPDVEAAIDAEDFDYVEYFTALLTADESLLPTEVGHEYICDQILAAEDITIAKGLKGDVNLDGVVDASDTAMLFDYALERITLSPLALANGDMNEDGSVDASDTAMVFDYVLAGK